MGAVENLELLDPKFKGMKWSSRKNYFHDVTRLKEYHFEPGLVYTVSCYTHMMAPTSYMFHILGTKWGISQYMPSAFQICAVVLPEGREAREVAESQSAQRSEETSSSSNDTDTVENMQNVENVDNVEEVRSERLQSEAMASESKEDEDAEEEERKKKRPTSPRSGFRDLNGCECLVNLQVWHTKLCEELYPKPKKQRKSSSGLKALFGGGK